jgi:hypothetical protein
MKQNLSIFLEVFILIDTCCLSGILSELIILKTLLTIPIYFIVRSLGRPTYRWEDIIKIYLKEIGWEGEDWILLDQDRDQWQALVNMVMNIQVP